MNMYLYTCLICFSIYRQLEGEHLQELSLASLMKLEKLIEGGMSRIRKTKVCTYSL